MFRSLMFFGYCFSAFDFFMSFVILDLLAYLECENFGFFLSFSSYMFNFPCLELFPLGPLNPCSGNWPYTGGW